MYTNVERVQGPDELDWGWALAETIRLLADPTAHARLARCPTARAGVNDFTTALGYWTALDHLLRYQLGWTHPAEGLARWQDEGADDACPTLALIRRIWLGDGFLNHYLAWRVQKCPDHVPVAWQSRLRRVRTKGGEGQPIGPGQLHLEEEGMHVLEPQDAVKPSHLIVGHREVDELISSDPSQPDGLMVFDDKAGLQSGWYGHLNHLPSHFDSVEVYATRFGRCGLYRRSPATSRWHTTYEAVHTWGTRSPVAAHPRGET